VVNLNRWITVVCTTIGQEQLFSLLALSIKNFILGEILEREIMTQKISLEEANKRLYEKHGNKITMCNYVRMNENASFICNVCGYEWDVSANVVIYMGCGCDRCADRRNGDKLFRTYESVKEEIESWGCQIVSTEYYGERKKLEIIFTCGHSGKISFNDLRTLKIKECRKCRALTTMRLPREIVISRVESYGFGFIRFIEPYERNSSSIEYECSIGHITKKTINDFSNNPTCKECKRIDYLFGESGSKSHRWRGGLSEVTGLLGHRIPEWKRESMESCGYKCIITGGKFDHIHHLYPMNKIVQEVFFNIGLEKKRTLEEYSDEEISAIVYETKRLHTIYPLGVCLRKDIHDLFHSSKMYGNKDFTPDDFYEFYDRIQSGDIQLPT
jgi:hypothetical protein